MTFDGGVGSVEHYVSKNNDAEKARVKYIVFVLSYDICNGSHSLAEKRPLASSCLSGLCMR